jgi:hypothetical protein
MGVLAADHDASSACILKRSLQRCSDEVAAVDDASRALARRMMPEMGMYRPICTICT